MAHHGPVPAGSAPACRRIDVCAAARTPHRCLPIARFRSRCAGFRSAASSIRTASTGSLRHDGRNPHRGSDSGSGPGVDPSGAVPRRTGICAPFSCAYPTLGIADSGLNASRSRFTPQVAPRRYRRECGQSAVSNPTQPAPEHGGRGHCRQSSPLSGRPQPHRGARDNSVVSRPARSKEIDVACPRTDDASAAPCA